MDRRDFIKTTTAATAATGARTLLSAPSAAARQPDLIRKENTKPGASFQLTRMRPDDAKSYRTSLIEGYCPRQSVKAGERPDIFVSTKPAAKFAIEIFRMGYYDGAGARLMATLGPLVGKTQPVPEIGEQRLRECQWDASTSLTSLPTGPVVCISAASPPPSLTLPTNPAGRATSSSSSKMTVLPTSSSSAATTLDRPAIAGL